MSQSRAPSSLLRNTAAQSAPLALGYLLSFLSAPVILGGLGIRQFGIWALTDGLAAYVGLLDLGFGASLSRFIAVQQDDRRTCGEYIGIGLMAVACVGLCASVGALVGAGPLSRALHGISSSDMRIVLLSGAVLLVGSMLSNVVAAFAQGHRRMFAPNLGLTIGLVVNFVASIGSIALGAGLPGYALANAGAGIVSAVLVIGLVLKAEGPIPIAWPRHVSVTGFFGYSLKAQLARVADLINYQTDKVVIAFAVGPSAAGAYELANRIAVAARQPGVYPLTALVPTLAIDRSRFGIDHIRRRYARLMEIAVAFGVPSLVLTAALAPMLLGAWLSHVPPYATAVLAALSLGYIANVSSGVGYVVGLAAGDPGVAARAAAGTAVANVILTVALAPEFGMWGVLGGTVLALTGGALVQVMMTHRRFSLPFAAYRDGVAPTLRVCAILAVPVAILSYSRMINGRALQACAVIAMSLGYLVLYGRWAMSAGRLPEKFLDWMSRISMAVQRRLAF
jgi:O-antigen/teichoic acid export membrane protein